MLITGYVQKNRKINLKEDDFINNYLLFLFEEFDLASDAGIVDKSGAWYSYNGEKIGQGKENVKAYLRQNTKLRDEIETKLRKHYDIGKEIKTKEEK